MARGKPLSHDIYPPAGYDYRAEHYCLDCIPVVACGSDSQIILNPVFNECGCTECKLDRLAVVREINRQDEASYDMDSFPKGIPYHNDLHAECGDSEREAGDSVCYERCARCSAVIDGPCPAL